MKTPGEDKYIQVPKRIASHLRLFSEADLKTYLGVLHFLGSERGWAFTTLTDLAGYVGLSARSIKKSLGRLLAFGYVKYRFGKGQNAKRKLVLAEAVFRRTPRGPSPDFSTRPSLSFPPPPPDSPPAKGKVKNGHENPTHLPSSTGKEKININITGKERELEREGTRKRGTSPPPETPEEQLAMRVAERLGDRAFYPLLASYCQKYPEGVIREALAEWEQLPREVREINPLQSLIRLIHKHAP